MSAAAAHDRTRELSAFDHGARLIPPRCVNPRQDRLLSVSLALGMPIVPLSPQHDRRRAKHVAGSRHRKLRRRATKRRCNRSRARGINSCIGLIPDYRLHGSVAQRLPRRNQPAGLSEARGDGLSETDLENFSAFLNVPGAVWLR